MEAPCAPSTSPSPSPYRIFNFYAFPINFLVRPRNLGCGGRVHIRANPFRRRKQNLPRAEAWTRGGLPMPLFPEAQPTLGSSMIQVGPYSVYPTRGKDHWTLPLKKNVTAGAAYD